MNFKWKKLSLCKKMLSPYTLLVIFFFVFITLYFLPLMKEEIINQKREKLRDIIETKITLMENLEKEVQEGSITEEEAKEIIKKAIVSARYGPEKAKNEYLWINDLDHVMLVHPIKPALNGKNLVKMKDPNGVFLIQEMVAKCKAKGYGYVDYVWEHPATKKAENKISYVKLFKPWGWVVGTGIYIVDVEKQFNKLYFNVLLTLIIIFGTFSILLVYVVFQTIKPIKHNVVVANKIAMGDLTTPVEVETDEGEDEVGKLSLAISKMQQKLSRVMKETVGTASTLSLSSEEISKTALDLSETAAEQAANVEEVSSTMEEMGAAISQNSENSKQTNNMAKTTSEMADIGSEAVNKTVQAIKDIAGKINIVQEIASRTNLLALNASIEASRAGVHGKGFAVVAAEVRELAQKSHHAAKDISELAINSVELAEQAEKLLHDIVPGVKKTADLIDDISSSSEQQDLGVEQINGSMSQLSEITQSTAASSEELASTSDILKNQAINLEQIVSFFQLEKNEQKEESEN